MDLLNICSDALIGINKMDGIYTEEKLLGALNHIIRPNMSEDEIRDSIIQVSLELTTDIEPDWQKISEKLYVYKLYDEVRKNRNLSKDVELYSNLYDFIEKLTNKGLYGKYILENYTKDDILELEKEIKPERDFLFTYSGINLLAKRYLIQDYDRSKLELPQQMFMGIAMHLAIPEKKENRVAWAKRFYDVLSSLKATMATPTMSNARKPFYQLSSCFIDTVEDSLKGIYKSLDNFAEVSKFGGGMGIYIGKVRALESPIRGFKGASGGVIPWIKLFNDTAIAVDQLGVRNGSVAIWLDAWHKDLPEFLQLRTNNGDDRKKAHDVFPGLCYPDLFWKLAETDIDANWYMMCPHEIRLAKGYSLEDFYGEEWEKKYYECVEDENISKRVMSVKDIVRLIIKSAAETGTPFAFYRDTVNKMNPNKHMGMIYSSNLCTEIMQNMSPMDIQESEIIDEDGSKIIVEKTKAGDFVVCNLSSIVLGNVDVKNEEEIAIMKEASVINDSVMEKVADFIKEGMTEKEVADFINAEFFAAGASGLSFDTIVCFGPNAADQHHEPSETRTLKAGECVLIDMGCVWKGYCSDMTRTFFYKKGPSKEQEIIYNLVKNACESAEEYVQPGRRLCDIDSIARDIITEGGYGPDFTHRLGHFIGQEDHEYGDVSQGFKEVTVPGNIFSIEPGIYHPSILGCRIEDLILVTEDGHEVLNHYPREIEIIG